MTAEELFPEVPPVLVVVCCGCTTLTSAPIAVRWIPRASGPGVTLYACPSCAPKLGAAATPGDVIRTQPS
jgi:hypothetical protein